ncbi:MAG TPA: tRNA isopentenyl-2-thiomethyl-A-37 hydroxylase MiaE [Vicinamibacteria bacterium]|nr:tRNA isopentenyl-2-thiomethyl-A-37 hydroxylase MiaE [Vicinamibacteria bacterium]
MLLSTTPPSWVELACRHIDTVLVDHAHCEKKAAASALSLIAAHPSKATLVRALSALAIEELQHFRAVHNRIVARGLTLGRDPGDPYAQRLLALAGRGRSRLVDKLLIFGLIEARSHERLDLLATHLREPELAGLYRQLAGAESRHAATFQELAARYASSSDVDRRLQELAALEAEIVEALPIAPRIH